MKEDIVSVILPTFGRPDRLSGAVYSVLNQTYQNFELVIVDDNPPGSEARLQTETVLRSFGDHRICYVQRENNGGGAAARNTGVTQCSGAYICFLDDDDRFHKNKIEDQILHIKDNRLDVSLCYIDAKIEGAVGGGVQVAPICENIQDFVLHGNVMNGMMMMKKTVFNTCGGFEKIPRFQDHILMFKIFSANLAVGVLPKKLYFSLIHRGPRISSSANSIEAYRVRHDYENKYRYLLSSEESSQLTLRQDRSLLRCHAESVGQSERFKLLLMFILRSVNSGRLFSNIVFAARVLLSRSLFLKKIRYFVAKFGS